MDASRHLLSFHELMQNRVQRILMVSSLYDSFIMSEEGHLHESLLSQFIDLNVTNIPDLVRVPSGGEALKLLAKSNDFDLIIASLHTVDGNAAQLTRELREAGHDTPVIAMAYTNRELSDFLDQEDASVLERTFLWQGDIRVLLAVVKYFEDRINIDNDTGIYGVPAIVVVEDNARYYSSFLPAIYSELFGHTHRLLSEDLNLSQKMMRMRARPKVILCETYEEAWTYLEKYSDNILGVISDVEFPREGQLDKHAGIMLCTRARDLQPSIRLVIQSSVPANEELADQIGASFLLKGSALLLSQLQSILINRFGFGDFVFRLEDRTAVDSAHDLKEFSEKLISVPAESIGYHAARNHFSNWMKARTEFALAARLLPCKVSEFDSLELLREHLLEKVIEYRRERQRTIISDFDRDHFEPSSTITRIGSGSLGGKARGVAFANRILHSSGVDAMFPTVDIHVPPSVVLSTEVFDKFMSYSDLREQTTRSYDDETIEEIVTSAPFPRKAVADLRSFVQQVHYPLSVRSSSLLEDSISQPFAGVYETYMLPNNDPDIDVRWRQLTDTVKRVYASTFLESAKSYLSMTSFRLEEEKMAVMVQQLVGNQHSDRFYPDFSGVARSFNFYPEPGHTADEGVVAVALGLGRTVVSGNSCLRFNPYYPQELVSFSTIKGALDTSQRNFYALNLDRATATSALAGTEKFPIDVAEEDGPLAWLGSTFLPGDNRIVDGISRPGIRLVSFAQILKHDAFPLAEILRQLLKYCAHATGGPVEIEFAGNFAKAGESAAQFAFLQLRPLAMSKEEEQVVIGAHQDEDLVCRTSQMLGNGTIENIHDIVVVDIDNFDRLRSAEIAVQVAHFDALLRNEKCPYMLVGVGRWGSADASLGIPVSWSQISGARVIVESGFKDMHVAPSQGTHFFQNLTSCNVGYLTVNPGDDRGFLDWSWLASLPAAEETEFVRRICLENPLTVKLDGRTGEAVVIKPKLKPEQSP
ncbi:MAG: CheY-like chemotaxis protein [Planctomycetota bacterium]